MSHPSWIFNESPIFASSFSQRAPRRQHGDELSSLSFLLCTFPIHYPKYMLYIICSLYNFPKNIYFHYTFKNYKVPKQGKKGCSLQALMILVLLLSCLLVCLRKHESWIVASRDLAKLQLEFLFSMFFLFFEENITVWLRRPEFSQSCWLSFHATEWGLQEGSWRQSKKMP